MNRIRNRGRGIDVSIHQRKGKRDTMWNHVHLYRSSSQLEEIYL